MEYSWIEVDDYCGWRGAHTAARACPVACVWVFSVCVGVHMMSLCTQSCTQCTPVTTLSIGLPLHVCMCRQFILNCHAENHTFEHVHTPGCTRTPSPPRAVTPHFSQIYLMTGGSRRVIHMHIVKIVHNMF
jgi:hypothetical protein